MECILFVTMDLKELITSDHKMCTEGIVVYYVIYDDIKKHIIVW